MPFTVTENLTDAEFLIGSNRPKHVLHQPTRERQVIPKVVIQMVCDEIQQLQHHMGSIILIWGLELVTYIALRSK